MKLTLEMPLSLVRGKTQCVSKSSLRRFVRSLDSAARAGETSVRYSRRTLIKSTSMPRMQMSYLQRRNLSTNKELDEDQLTMSRR